MAVNAKNLLKKLRRDVSKEIPAFDELILLTLKRYYLSVKKLNFISPEDDYNDEFNVKL